ncbi:unnamed protein product [Linum trigynum]|uniref:Uncharacterized protein n=1 Tax=Linum trigynum TaxID=586398 RepID=A0AAV2GIX7_9ROSI
MASNDPTGLQSDRRREQRAAKPILQPRSLTTSVRCHGSHILFLKDAETLRAGSPFRSPGIRSCSPTGVQRLAIEFCGFVFFWPSTALTYEVGGCITTGDEETSTAMSVTGATASILDWFAAEQERVIAESGGRPGGERSGTGRALPAIEFESIVFF